MTLLSYIKTLWANGMAPAINSTNLNKIESGIHDVTEEVIAHEADYKLQVPYGGTATNVGNAYSITTPAIAALAAGMAICVKCNADSTGAVTLNWNGKGAKSVLKANGTAVTNWKNGGIYTLRYDGANFMLQGEGATGTATASDLLSGKTATTDAGEITGTMQNRAGDTAALALSISGTTLKLRASQGYRDGVDDNVTHTDPNRIPGNIKQDVALDGLVGTLVPLTTEKKWASGIGTITSGKMITVSGLSFKPVYIIALAGNPSDWDSNLDYTYCACVNTNINDITFIGPGQQYTYISRDGGYIGANGFSLYTGADSGKSCSWIAFE